GKASPDLLLAREKAISALREQPVPSAQQDERRHSCTRRTRTALLNVEPDRRDALSVSGVGIAKVSVALETIDRALDLLETLIRTAESLGHAISGPSVPAALVIDSQTLRLRSMRTSTESQRPPMQRNGHADVPLSGSIRSTSSDTPTLILGCTDRPA